MLSGAIGIGDLFALPRDDADRRTRSNEPINCRCRRSTTESRCVPGRGDLECGISPYGCQISRLARWSLPQAEWLAGPPSACAEMTRTVTRVVAENVVPGIVEAGCTLDGAIFMPPAPTDTRRGWCRPDLRSAAAEKRDLERIC